MPPHSTAQHSVRAQCTLWRLAAALALRARPPPSAAPSGLGPWQCDKIASLAEYKDQSCPTFMLYKVRHRRDPRARPRLPLPRCLLHSCCRTGHSLRPSLVLRSRPSRTRSRECVARRSPPHQPPSRESRASTFDTLMLFLCHIREQSTLRSCSAGPRCAPDVSVASVRDRTL